MDIFVSLSCHVGKLEVYRVVIALQKKSWNYRSVLFAISDNFMKKDFAPTSISLFPGPKVDVADYKVIAIMGLFKAVWIAEKLTDRR